jgi:TetR/AcrR family transcriptional regulator, transcriptional repressor for nem operon
MSTDRISGVNSMDTRETILAAARAAATAHGYGGLSFRELAREVGIKSASIHYHFPTKGDLAVALARQYTDVARGDLQAILDAGIDPPACFKRYVALFRKALENGNRMCLCGILAAGYDDIPKEVRAEVVAFADLNVEWITKVLRRVKGSKAQTKEQWAQAIYAAIGGAQLAARSRGDIATYDRIVESYGICGLIPR